MTKKKRPLAYLVLLALLLFLAPISRASETAPAQIGSPTLATGLTGSVFTSPTASLAPGTYTTAQNVVLSAPGSAYIRYTTDNSTPTCQSGAVYSGAIAVNSSIAIKAISCVEGMSSLVKTFSYTISIQQQSARGSGGGGGGGGSIQSILNASMLINNGEISTDDQQVILSLTADGADEMIISNSENFDDVSWEAFNPSKNWTLTSDPGAKTVYAKFKKTFGNPVSASATINLIVEEPESKSPEPKNDQPIVAGVETDWRTIQIEMILDEADYIKNGDCTLISANAGKARNIEAEKSAKGKYTDMLLAGINGLTEVETGLITCFVHYGTESTKQLGAGERAGVVNSYKAAFGKLPRAESEWEDVIKIANGRWPTERSTAAEAKAKIEFKTVYLRNPAENQNDEAAVTVMAYGLRSSERNLASEAAAIKIFKAIYKYNPKSATDWDIVRAIAYSGAKR
jgi:hypothetical protein